jgi:xanthine/uracil permease
MNDTTTNKGQIYIIVCAIVVLAVICVYTMCVMAYYGKDIPQALSLLTGGLVGSLGTMLTKTTPTESTKQPLPNPPSPTPSTDNPLPVKPITSVADPVHTEEAPK